MLPTVRINLLQRLSPSWLVGPLFGNELRVASRQRKSYVLRFAYVGLLTVFVAGVWFSSAPGGRSIVAYQASRMATAGKHIAVTIVWFQFIAAQLLAVALLVKAMDREIRKRTLHILAVTPLSGVQIVWGKLAGGLLPIVMLLAASLPLLAIVRVLGGVSWDYVLSGVCITFTATVFIGVLSLVPSAPYGNTFVAVLLGVWYVVLSRGMDALIDWLAHFVPAVGKIGMPVLLTIPWEDRGIVRDEALAVLCRGHFFLASLSVLTLLLLMALMAFMPRVTALDILWGAGLYLISLLGLVPFLVGLGLYCSVRLKTIAGASACMFVLLFGLILAGVATVVPVVRRGSLGGPQRWLIVSGLTILAALVLAGAGWILLKAASRRLRRNVF